MTVPFICVLAYFAIIYLSRVPVAIAQKQDPTGYDNSHPRDQQARLVGWGRRAQAAHQNAFELFGPFAAAVLIAHQAGADPRWSTIFAVTVVAARALYPVLYIADLATLRSLVWSVSFGGTCALFFLPFFR